VIASKKRSGFAVATAVFALVVVTALAIGTLFAATHEVRSGADTIHLARALMAAEFGIEQTVATWNRQWNALARGFGQTLTLSTPDGAALNVNVARLADELFLVTSEARAGPARRQVARVVRLDTDDPPLRAALGLQGVGQVGESVAIDGSDHSPSGWDCTAPGPPLPPFIIIADTSELLRFGHFDWDELVSLATTRLTQSVTNPSPRWTDEECDTNDPTNWGEPTRSNGGACTGYFPVVHAPSDLTISGGRGEGLLLVDGDLTLQGGFEFFGALLVRGALRDGPGGARVTGAVAMAGQGATESPLERIAIDFSRCAVRKALLALARPVPIVERSWYEVFEPQ
jgi:hypothetical protein